MAAVKGDCSRQWWARGRSRPREKDRDREREILAWRMDIYRSQEIFCWRDRNSFTPFFVFHVEWKRTADAIAVVSRSNDRKHDTRIHAQQLISLATSVIIFVRHVNEACLALVWESQRQPAATTFHTEQLVLNKRKSLPSRSVPLALEKNIYVRNENSQSLNMIIIVDGSE